MAVTQTPDGRWLVYYRQGKGRKKEYFGRGPEAERAARERNAALGLGERKGTATPASGPTFKDLAMAYVASRPFSENSRRHAAIRLTANILPRIGHRPAMALSTRDMDAYVRDRRKDGVKDSTIRREITDIKAILSHAARSVPPAIPANPVRDYAAPRSDDAVIIPPTDAEIGAILAAASPHMKRFVLLVCHIGCRPGAVELLSLRWSDVLWPVSAIRVTSAKKGGSTARNVPLHPDLVPYLTRWIDEDAAAFPTRGIGTVPLVHYHGEAVQKIGKAWRATLERAGITRRIRPYDLRHRFVTQALEASADPKALSEVVGSRPATLMRHYQHVTRSIHRTTVELVPGIPCDPKKDG